MFERFTTDAREVVLGAVLVAGELDSPVVGTEHVLVSLAGEPGAAGKALRAAGVTGDRLRAELAERRGPADGERRLDPDALASIGIDVDEVRRAIEEVFGPDALSATPGRGRRRWWTRTAERSGHRRFTPESKAVLERSLRAALALRDKHLGTEHILLGVLGPDGPPPASAATALLAACGIDAAALRATLSDRRKAG